MRSKHIIASSLLALSNATLLAGAMRGLIRGVAVVSATAILGIGALRLRDFTRLCMSTLLVAVRRGREAMAFLRGAMRLRSLISFVHQGWGEMQPRGAIACAAAVGAGAASA